MSGLVPELADSIGMLLAISSDERAPKNTRDVAHASVGEFLEAYQSPTAGGGELAPRLSDEQVEQSRVGARDRVESLTQNTKAP